MDVVQECILDDICSVNSVIHRVISDAILVYVFILRKVIC